MGSDVESISSRKLKDIEACKSLVCSNDNSVSVREWQGMSLVLNAMCKLRCYITSDGKLLQGLKKDVTGSY